MPEAKTSVELRGLKVEQEEIISKLRDQLTSFSEAEKQAAIDSVWNMLLDMEQNQSKKEMEELQSQILSGEVKVNVTDNHGTITINQENNVYNITIEGARAVPPEQPTIIKKPEIPVEDDHKNEQSVSPVSTPVQVVKPDSKPQPAQPDKSVQSVPSIVVPQTNESPVAPASVQQTKPEDLTNTNTDVQVQAVPETPEQRYDEMRDILSSLSRELVPDQSGNIVLTGAQMQKLNRISLLRAPFFGVGVPKELAEAMGRSDIITADDLKNEKTLKAKRKEIEKQLKKEKKYNRQLGKLLDTYIDYLNAKNSTNYSLNKAAALGQINEVLENGTYINQSLAFMPEVSPLILNICQKGNRDRLAANQSIQIMNNGKTINVFPESVGSATEAASYLATCGAGGYANIAEKWLTENTKMSQGQARSMLNTVGSLGLIAGVVGIGYWLFTKKDGDGRKFSFPSLGKIAGIIGIPLLANYASQMTTGNSLLDNIATAWKTGKFPWSSSESLSGNEQLCGQQVMSQFVLLGIPKKVIKLYGEFNNQKLTKLKLDGMITYLGSLESNPSTPSNDRARFGIQKAAMENIKNDDSAKTALFAYIENLGITESELDSDPDGYLNERLSDASQKLQKALDYGRARGLQLDKDKTKLNKVMDTLSKEKDLDDKVFDKLKEEGCFIPDPDSNQYKEIAKLSVSNDRKIKIQEAFAKLGAEGTKYGQMTLKVDGGKVKLTSGTGNKEVLLNSDLTIDGFEDSAGSKLILKNEEEWLRTGLLVNQIKSSVWGETPEAAKRDAPFELTGGVKFWESIQFAKHDGGKVVLSSFLPFISEMASNHPTIEKDNNRQFFVEYLNKLWKADHPT